MDLRLDFPAEPNGSFHLLIAPRPHVDQLTDACIARLALAAEVRVLDGGNRFDLHSIARQVRSRTPELQAALEQVRIARAFTCYQMAALLGSQPGSSSPLLALNLLTVFHDENVPEAERLRLLGQCLAELKRLAARAPLLVSAIPPRTPAAAISLARLSAAAGTVWRLEPAVQAVQRAMF